MQEERLENFDKNMSDNFLKHMENVKEELNNLSKVISTTSQKTLTTSSITIGPDKQIVPPKMSKTALSKKVRSETEKRKSSTSILCELTRLKSQQKYLECSQIKLKYENFPDFPTSTNNSSCLSSPKSAPESKIPVTETNVASLISDIDNLKIRLEENLHDFEEKARNEVQNIFMIVNSLKEDIFKPERLQECSIQAIRERAIAANTQLERLQGQNSNELKRLQTEYLNLQNELKQYNDFYAM